MRLLKHQDTALIIVTYLAMAKDSGLIPLSGISHDHGISVSYLKKIVRLLRSAGLVKSREGRSGGYKLAVNPAAISVWDVVVAVDQADKLKEYDRSPAGACPLHTFCLPQVVRSRVAGVLKQVLSELTVGDLAKGGTGEKTGSH